MEAVKAFNQELSGLYETKPPISRGKMTALTKSAIKAIKLYKHVVQSVEKFIQKCRPEYKVPGLYVIDSIVRQSRHQFSQEKDVFVPRFSKNIQTTFTHLFKCPPEDKAKIVRVLNLWQKNAVFSAEIVQPLLDLANPQKPDESPESPPPIVEEKEKKRAEPDWVKEQASAAADHRPKQKAAPSPHKKSRSHRHSQEDKTLAMVSSLLMQAQEGSSEHQQLQQLQLIQETIQKQTKVHHARPANKETLKLDEAVLNQIQSLTKQLTSLANQGTAALTEEAGPSPPPQPVKGKSPPAAVAAPAVPQEKHETGGFNSALLEFDYGDEEEDIPRKVSSPPPVAPVPAPQANPPLPPQAPPERHAVAPPQEPDRDETLQASIAAVQKLTDELNHAQTQQEQMKQFMEHQDQQMMQHHHIPPPSGPPPPMMMHHQGPPPPMMPPQFFHPHHHQQYQIPLPPMNQPPPPTGHPMGALPTAMTTMVTSDQYQPEFPSEDVPTVISASPIRETGDMPVVVADSPPPQKETTHRSRSKSPRKKRGRSRSKSRSPHSSTRRKHRSKRRHRSRSRSQERSRGKRSRSRSRDRSRSRRHDRDEREEKDENRSSDRKRGFPSLRENKASICSLTIWMGRLPKSVSEKEIRYLVEENGGGEVVSVHIVSARGCAYVLMTDRAEAAKVLDNLKYAKLHGANIKVAWAPGVGVKDKKYKDHWDVERGVSYIPWDIFSGHPGKLEELEEGSFVDIESLPEEIKKLRQPLVEEPPEMGEDQGATDPEHQEPADHVPPTQSSGSPPAPANTTAPPPRFVGITPGAPVVRMSMMPGGMLPPFMGMRLNLPPGMMPPPPHGGLTPADMHSSGDAEQHPPTSIAPPLPPFGILRPGMPPLGPQVLESMPLSGSPTPHLIGQMPNRLMGLLPPRIAGLSLPVAPGRPDNKLGGPLEPPSEPKGLLGSPPGLPPGAALLLENQAKRMDGQEGMQGGMREEVDLQEKMGEMGLPPPVSLLGDLSQFAGPALRMVRPTLSQAMLPQGMMPGLVSLPRMMVPGGMMRLPGGQGIPVSLPAGLRLAPGMLAPRGLPPGMLPMVPPEIMNLLRPPIPTIETPDEQPEDEASKDVDDRVIPDYGASSPFQKEGPEGEELFNNGPPNQEAPKGDQDFRAKDRDLREPWPRPPGMMPDFRGPPPPLFRPDFPIRGPRPPWGPPFRGPPPRGMLPMGPGRPPFRGPPQHEFGPPNGPPGRWGGMEPEWRHRPPLPSLLDQDFRGGQDQDWRPRPWGIDQGMGGGPPPFPEGPPEEMDGFSGRESQRDFDQRRGNNRNWDRSRENGGRGPDHRDRSSEREERDHGDKDHRGDRDSRRGGRDRDYRAETRDAEKKEEESDLGGKDDIKRKERSQAKDKSSGDPEKRRKSRWAPVTDEAPPKPLLDIVIPAMKLKPHLAGPSPLVSQEEEKPPVLGKLSPVSKPALIDDATTPVKDEKPVFEEKTVDSQGPVLVDEKLKESIGGEEGLVPPPKESIGGEGLVPPPKESIGGEGLVPPPATTDDTPHPKVEGAAEPPKVEIGNNNIVKEGKTEAESVEEPAESEEKPDK